MDRVELRPRRERPAGGFFPINRNFCNFPIARDGHVRPDWEPSTHTGRLIADLPGDKRIWFRLPDGATPRALPNGFDMCILFALLRAARMDDSNVATFRSRAALLAQMGYVRKDRLYRALDASLDLWSAIEIGFDEWYDSDRWEKTEDGTRRISGEGKIKCKLRAPIRSIGNDGRKLRIVLDGKWLALFGKHYFAKIPSPLPTRASAQNLVLWLSCATAERHDGTRFTPVRTRRELCHIIGVTHGDRMTTLDHAIDAAADWFEARGRELVLHEPRNDGRFVFSIGEPERAPERKPTAPAPRRQPAPTRPREPVGPRPVRVPATFENGRSSFVWTVGGRLMNDDEVAAHERRSEFIGMGT
jgi:hypothetical protein